MSPRAAERAAGRIAAVRAAVMATIEAAGFARVDPPILQPAGPFLSLFGEEMRRRIHVLESADGDSHCLRLDLTGPVARLAIAEGWLDGRETRLCADGAVFREPPPDRAQAREFVQCGFERFDDADAAAADAETLSLARDAVAAAGVGAVEITLGDVGLFAGLVDAVDAAAPMRARLKRAFWGRARLAHLLDRLADSAATQAPERAGFLDALAALSDDQANAIVTEIVRLAGGAHVPGRPAEAVAARFVRHAAEGAAGGLPDAQRALLEGHLALDIPADEVAAGIAARASAAGIAGPGLAAALVRWSARLERLAAQGFDPHSLRFRGDFGRNLEYYTGFVFELSVGDAQVAGGGRYDGLVAALGAERPVTAVGCAIRPETIAALTAGVRP